MKIQTIFRGDKLPPCPHLKNIMPQTILKCFPSYFKAALDTFCLKGLMTSKKRRDGSSYVCVRVCVCVRACVCLCVCMCVCVFAFHVNHMTKVVLVHSNCPAIIIFKKK